MRKDRLIAVAAKSLAYRKLKSLEQLSPAESGEDILLEEIEHFSYKPFNIDALTRKLREILDAPVAV